MITDPRYPPDFHPGYPLADARLGPAWRVIWRELWADEIETGVYGSWSDGRWLATRAAVLTEVTRAEGWALLAGATRCGHVERWDRLICVRHADCAIVRDASCYRVTPSPGRR